MQEKNSNKIDEKLLEKIIAVAYSDAVWYDRMVVRINAMRNPEIKELLDEYKLMGTVMGTHTGRSIHPWRA